MSYPGKMRDKQPGFCSSSGSSDVPEAVPASAPAPAAPGAASSAIASSQAQVSGSCPCSSPAGRTGTNSRLAPHARQFRLSEGQVPPHAGQVLLSTLCCGFVVMLLSWFAHCIPSQTQATGQLRAIAPQSDCPILPQNQTFGNWIPLCQVFRFAPISSIWPTENPPPGRCAGEDFDLYWSRWPVGPLANLIEATLAVADMGEST